jgi:WD40 repeat protein
MVRGWRLIPVAVAALAAATAVTVVAVAVNALTGGTAGWYRMIERHPLWWTAGATAAAAVTALAAWRVQAWYERRSAELVPAMQQPEPWVVDRPTEVNRIVVALRRRGGGTVGVTIAVQGAGGFGKTTVAKIVRADRRVLRRFRGRAYWVTVGRDAGKEMLPGLVNGLIAQIQPGTPVTFTDARQASSYFATLVARGPRRLVIVDDVWTEEQLAAFPAAGRCARLVTTRNPSLVPDAHMRVGVDQMTASQARALLLVGLPPLPHEVVAGLLEVTGRWPLLLRLVNKFLTGQTRLQPDVTTTAREFLGRLRAGGVLQVDELTGAAGQRLDVGDPDQRSKAVRATIEASTDPLRPGERDRLAELAVFVEDEIIPVPLIVALWRATAGLDEIEARSLCARLADLALLTPAPRSGTVTMHDVIRQYLTEELDAARLEQLHQILLDTTAKNLPTAAAVAGPGLVTAWWEVPDEARYLWGRLIEHMHAAGRTGQAEDLAGDLRWVGARLEQSGPAGPFADLAMASTPRSARLCRLLGQAAHLLAPTDPGHSRIDILYSRVAADPGWAVQARALGDGRTLPALTYRWPLPDQPDALRRTLTGHALRSETVMIARDSSWLAAGGADGRVLIFDPVTGRQCAAFPSQLSHVEEVAFHMLGIGPPLRVAAIDPDGTWYARPGSGGSLEIWDMLTGRQRATLEWWQTAASITPDGTLLATAAIDGRLLIWDTATWERRAIMTSDAAVTATAIAPDATWLLAGGMQGHVQILQRDGRSELLPPHADQVTAAAIAADSTWFATASRDGTARIWDASTRHPRVVLGGHGQGASAVAIAHDGTWLATGSNDGVIRVWEAATGQQSAALTGHTAKVTSLSIAPDDTWLASGSHDLSIRIWDVVGGHTAAELIAQIRSVSTFAFAARGNWVAAGSNDGTARIWDAATGQQRAVLAGHTSRVTSLSISPDGTWLTTTSDDGTARIWDAATGHHRTTLTGHMTKLAISPDGTWLAAGIAGGTVLIWDAATGQQRFALPGHGSPVTALAISPDGTWLTAASSFGPVQIWDAATGQQRFALADGRFWPVRATVAIAPDGTWLITASDESKVRIWDAVTGRERATLSRRFSRGQRAQIAIAPDGSWLAISDRSRLVHIWDVATGSHRLALTGHTDEVTAVAISPDRAWIASASHDRSVRIWDAAGGDAVAVMRVDGKLEDCRWNPTGQSLAVRGSAGLYHFTFKP